MTKRIDARIAQKTDSLENWQKATDETIAVCGINLCTVSGKQN